MSNVEDYEHNNSYRKFNKSNQSDSLSHLNSEGGYF